MAKNPSQKPGKIIQADYDYVFSLNGDLSVCLTRAQIAWLLSQNDYAGWKTRWNSNVGTPIDQVQINHFMSDLAFRLMIANEPCEGDEMPYLLRQNPSEPCQLEQSVDGGITWSLAFDYALCMRAESENPPLEQYDPVYGGHQSSYDGGLTWVDTPDYRFKSPLINNLHKDKDDPRCWTAENAVYVAQQMMITDDEQLLVDIIVGIVAALVGMFTGGAAAPVVVALAAALFNAGTEAVQAAMTDEVWEKFRDNLYCHASLDGSWTLPAYFEIYDQLTVDHTGLALYCLQQTMTILGYSGLNNAGRQDNVPTVDCSEVECDPECEEPLILGMNTFSMDGIEGWKINIGSLVEPGTVAYDYHEFPQQEFNVTLCFAEDFMVTAMSMQNRFSSGSVDMKYGIKLYNAEGGQIEDFPYFEGTTGGFDWFTNSSSSLAYTGVRKVEFYGLWVDSGKTWEFRNLKVTVAENP